MPATTLDATVSVWDVTSCELLQEALPAWDRAARFGPRRRLRKRDAGTLQVEPVAP